MKVVFQGEELDVKFDHYVSNDRIAIELTQNGEPYVMASVNVPDFKIKRNQVFIKNYSENDGVLKALVQGGVIEHTGFKYNGMFDLCRLTKEGKIEAEFQLTHIKEL
jgi:hypothetical protein